jgi:arsenate reductase (glutaredoxin)
MSRITFFEKPGCINNTKQKQWLEAAGHRLDVRNILEHPWTHEELRSYLPGTQPADWFNRTAPLIKSGELDPDAFNEAEALDAMVQMPLLIKRPLIQIDNIRLQGFNEKELATLIPLDATAGNEATVERLRNDNLTRCPQLTKKSNCDIETP